MNLTTKLLCVFTSATLGVLTVNTYFRIERERQLFDADMRKDELAHASTLAESVQALVAEPGGVARAAEVVESARHHSGHLNLRWVHLGEGPSVLDPPTVPTADLGAVRAGETAFRHVFVDGVDEAVVTYVPVRTPIPGEGPTAIEVHESLDEERAFIHGSIASAVASSAVLFLIAALATAFFGAAMVGRPLQKLRLKAKRAGEGDLSDPLLLPQRDELGELADELNAMCDRLAKARSKVAEAHAARLAALEQVRRADRLATVGQLSAGIAHEIGTPLGVIAGRSQMIATGEARDDEARECAGIVAHQTHRIAAIIRQLLDFSRKRKPTKADVDLAPLVKSVLELLEPMAKKRGAAIAIAEPDGIDTRVSGDAGQLQQAVTNLVLNAIQATEHDGKVDVSFASERRPRPHGTETEVDWTRVSVTDNGAGMDSETATHVFEPFFTTKEVGEGTGLGLAVSLGIVEEHGGWIDVQSAVGEGTRFSIHLPRAPAGHP